MRSLIVTLAFLATPALAQDHDQHAARGGLGKVSFPITCAAGIQPRFERAVAMLHSFWFETADSAFASIIKSDSTCAMAYWGRAITTMGNPMARVAPNAQRMALGLGLAQRAVALGANASHREQMYAATAMAFYDNYSATDHFARMKLQEAAFDALRKAHADDMEATIFYARTVIANDPPTDQTFASRVAAAELIQPLFDKHPDHPGLAHYIIHAYDAPPIARKGESAAKAYAGIAPDAPHALHMPSHIFTRRGMWDESIETNRRSARAEPDSNAAVHAMDYMVYAMLQEGRDRDAKAVLDRALLNNDRFYGGTLGYNFNAMPARYALERGDWKSAASLKLAPATAGLHVRAITHFARAVGAARSGNPAAARVDVDSLKSIAAQLEAAKDQDWQIPVVAQQLAASAWISLAERDTAMALRLAKEAADFEEKVEKNPVTPGPILPARELLGDLYAQLGKNGDAANAYEMTLWREPRRLRSVVGSARYNALSGNKDLARDRYQMLLVLMAKADASRSEVAEAKKYLGTK